MAFKNGDKVVQVIPAPISGTVVGFALDQETGEVHVRVQWDDEAGVHERHFAQTELAAE